MTPDKSRHGGAYAFLCLAALIAIFCSLHTGMLPLDPSFTGILLVITLLTCIGAIRSLPRIGFNFADPGLILILWITVTIVPVAVLSQDLELIRTAFWGIQDLEVLSKTFLAHVIFILSFTIAYVFFCSLYKVDFHIPRHRITTNKVWIVLFVIFATFLILYNIAFGIYHVNPWKEGSHVVPYAIGKLGLFKGQIYNKLALLVTFSYIFALGTFVARARTLNRARIRLFSILLVTFLLYYPVSTSRSFILVYGIGSVAYADVVRWKGSLLNWPLVLLCCVGGFAMDMATTIAESAIIYDNPDPAEKLTAGNLFLLQVAPVRNASIVISWVDRGDVMLMHGQTYVKAVKDLLPSQVWGQTTDSLSGWFIKQISPQMAEKGAGFAFGLVAEGYLNARWLGVFVEGLITGAFAGLVRYFQFSRTCKTYGSFFYAALTGGFFILYFRESSVIVSKFQWTILGTAFLVCFAHIMIGAAKRPTTLGATEQAILHQ